MRSTDFGRTWSEACVLQGDVWYDTDKHVVYENSLSCLAANDSDAYAAFGAIADNEMRTRTRGSINTCAALVGSPQMPWTINAMIVSDSLFVFSGWTDIPEPMWVSTNKGASWQKASMERQDNWAYYLCRLGTLIIGLRSDSVFVSSDSLKTAKSRPMPSIAGRAQSFNCRHDGIILAIGFDYFAGHSQFYESTDTARSWHQILENTIIPEIESAAFAGDTLLIHVKSTCNVVSVPDVGTGADVQVLIKSGAITLSGDYAKHPQSTVDIYDTIGRLAQRLTLNGDAASVGRVSFPFDQSLASVFVVCSSEGWVRVVESQ